VLADVLQQPLEVARRPEVGARGAAMAAMTAAGMDFDDEWTRPDGEVRPNEDLADLYREGFDRYLTTVEATRELWEARRAGRTRP
jgi:sugar (pentulose or hexulose) kinase